MPNMTDAQFDETNPLIIRIEPDAKGKWDIVPSTKDMLGSQTHSEVIGDRLKIKETQILKDWEYKKKQGSHPEPHFKRDPHVPVIVRAGESVKFRSHNNYPFSIWVDRDDEINPTAGSPQNPFGFSLPETASRGESRMMTVQQNVIGQRFYKCVAFVDVGGGNTIVVDPDVIGD